ncbi:MAG: PPC domain-containing protein [Planctomycetota bacterium]
MTSSSSRFAGRTKFVQLGWRCVATIFPFTLPLGLALCLALGLLPVAARAELPSIRFDRLQPLGGAAGTSFDVQIAGNDIEDVKTLLFDHPGLQATLVEGKERTFRITVNADVPSGTYDVRLVGRFGVSNPRLIAVTRGLQDIAEVEPNNKLDQSQLVPVNSAVHGASDQNDQDQYRVALKKGQRVTLQCQAGRLDSAMDATLTVTTRGGQSLASNGDYHGRDPFIDFIAPADDEYVVTVSDLSFRGGHPYQLIISDLPHLENVHPRAFQVGTTTSALVFGRNLPGGEPSGRTMNDLPLSQLRVAVNPPADLLTRGKFVFSSHPTDHSTLPTAATGTLTGFQLIAGLPQELLSAVPVVVTDQPVVVEQEPNDDREKPQRLTLPAMVSAQFDQPRDADWYEVEVETAGNYALDVYCERIAGRADPYVAVFDEKGNRVTELDDFGHRVNAFDGHLRDPSGNVSLNAKQKYRLLVQDRYRRGGSRYQYVLSLRASAGDFQAAVIHRQNPGPGGVTVGRGGETHLDVVIHHSGSFNGPVTISAESLPAGLHLVPTTIHGTSGIVVLTADETAAEWTGFISLTARGKVGETEIVRDVRSTTRVWTDTNMPASRPTRQLAVAIRDTAPYALRFAAEMVTVQAGEKVEVKLIATRRWPDFRGSITVTPLAFPNGLQMQNLEIAGNATEITVPLQCPANMRAGLYTISVQGQAQVPFAKDDKVATRPNTLVSQASRPLQLLVTEPPKAGK